MATYLDSCIVIYLHEGDLALRMLVRSRLDPLTTPLCISDLVRLECRVGPIRLGATPLIERYDRFFGLSEVHNIELTREVFDQAAHLRAQHGFRTPDALHLAVLPMAARPS